MPLGEKSMKPSRQELNGHGVVDAIDHQFMGFTPRSEMTGADRKWASRYDAGDVLRYQRGSKDLGLERGSYAEVIAVNAKSNLITVQRDTGGSVSYDPARVRRIDAYRETVKSLAVGDRLQMTAPYRDRDLPNRALGTVEQIANGELTVRMDSGRTVTVDPHEMRHFDHGYAVTSHSSQGLTAERAGLAEYLGEGGSIVPGDMRVHRYSTEILFSTFGTTARTRRSG
jgi:hypothetical protein